MARPTSRARPTKPTPPKPTTPRPRSPAVDAEADDATPDRCRDDRLGDSAITVGYDPRLDGDPDPGEIVWTWVPYEDDPAQGKDRPVVVIGHRGGGLVGVALTSKRHDRDPQVPVGTGSWDRDGRPSYAKVDRDPRDRRPGDATRGRRARPRAVRRRRRRGPPQQLER